MFQAAMALLASQGEGPRTHKGVRLRLQELDLLDLEARATLARAQALREQSDYIAAMPADERDAVTTVADAERFVEHVEAAMS